MNWRIIPPFRLKTVAKGAAGLLCLLLAQGCTYYYTQNSNIRGPLNQAIPGLAEAHPHRLRVRPYASFNTAHAMAFNDQQHTQVDSNGNYAVVPLEGDPENNYSIPEPDPNTHGFQGNNVHWKYEESAFGADLEYQLTPRWILCYGISRADVEGSIHWSHKVGWGLTGTLGDHLGVRSDVDVTWYSNRFDADMVREDLSTGGYITDDRALLYHKRGSHTYHGTSFRLTLNTLYPNLKVNYFLGVQGGVTPYFANAHEFLGLTAGGYWNATDHIRVIGGVAGQRYFGTYSLRFDAVYAEQPGMTPFLSAEYAFAALGH